MISTSVFEARYPKSNPEVSKQGLEAVIDYRRGIRDVYSSKNGRAELKRLIVDSKLFEAIDPESADTEIGIRNYAIKKLEDMGFLDERNIDRLIDSMFSLPHVGYEIEESET